MAGKQHRVSYVLGQTDFTDKSIGLCSVCGDHTKILWVEGRPRCANKVGDKQKREIEKREENRRRKKERDEIERKERYIKERKEKDKNKKWIQHRISSPRGITAFDNDLAIGDCRVCGEYVSIVWKNGRAVCKKRDDEREAHAREKSRQYRNRSQEYNRRTLLSKYGMTQEDYQTLFDSQNGKCGICDKEWEKDNPHFNIDHCHETNRVRGLLCSNCNRNLGRIGDNLESVMRFVNYLHTIPPIERYAPD